MIFGRTLSLVTSFVSCVQDLELARDTTHAQFSHHVFLVWPASFNHCKSFNSSTNIGNYQLTNLFYSRVHSCIFFFRFLHNLLFNKFNRNTVKKNNKNPHTHTIQSNAITFSFVHRFLYSMFLFNKKEERSDKQHDFV